MLFSQKDFDKAQKRLQSNKKVKRVYPKHCLSGMMECGICGHNMRHANSGRPKYECAFIYLDESTHGIHIDPVGLNHMTKRFDCGRDAAELLDRIFNSDYRPDRAKRI